MFNPGVRAMLSTLSAAVGSLTPQQTTTVVVGMCTALCGSLPFRSARATHHRLYAQQRSLPVPTWVYQAPAWFLGPWLSSFQQPVASRRIWCAPECHRSPKAKKNPKRSLIIISLVRLGSRSLSCVQSGIGLGWCAKDGVPGGGNKK